MSTATEWAARMVEAAQELPRIVLRGVTFTRVKYRSERYEQPDRPQQCRDCGVERGQFHVPVCCVEECPRCSQQMLSCRCDRKAHDKLCAEFHNADPKQKRTA